MKEPKKSTLKNPSKLLNQNLNYLFNKEYYSVLYNEFKIEEHFKNCNEHLVQANDQTEKMIEISKTNYFTLKTTYPGLLIGAGNIHESKKGNSEIKLGFTLDFVTGMPFIPGSTVKGVLRSHFRGHPEYIIELLRELNIIMTKKQINDLERAIFGEWLDETEGSVPTIINRDVFFDGVLVSGDAEGKILDLDNITPHINKNDPVLDGLTEPTPLSMIKVIPNVSFKFSFFLKENIIGENTLTVETKLLLFKRILTDLGIGAKTNVGYGNLKEV